LRKVLLVDDNLTQLRIREAVIRGAGFDVASALTAESALDILRASTSDHSVAIVITDHVMPGISGTEFVQELRNIDLSVPVVVLSGLAEAEAEYEGQNITFRLKPCAPSEMISLVQRLFTDTDAA